MAQLSHLEQWWNITLFLLKTYQDYIILVPMSCQVYSLDMRHTGGGIWKGDIPIADIEYLEQVDASELHSRRLNAKEVLTPMKDEISILPVADGTVKICGGDPRLRTSTLIRYRPAKERRTRNSSRRTQHWMMVKLEMISGRLQAILFAVITWNPESDCTRREKNHFLFR